MPNFFNTLADSLIDKINEINQNTKNTKKNFVIHSYANNDFGFTYRGYDGKMAKQKKEFIKYTRKKQGFFDFLVETGSRYITKVNDSAVTHYKLIQDLLKNTTIENCYSIWRGASPFDITNNIDEQQALLTLSLLMFEQEVNWGTECWQKHSNWNPRTNHPLKRPRDMIMGFVIMAFADNNDFLEYPYWNDNNGKSIDHSSEIRATPTFGSSGFNSLDIRFKKYFDLLENDNTASPLMIGPYLELFRKTVNSAPLNPYYSEYHKN